jgi:hypothetical protein
MTATQEKRGDRIVERDGNRYLIQTHDKFERLREEPIVFVERRTTAGESKHWVALRPGARRDEILMSGPRCEMFKALTTLRSAGFDNSHFAGNRHWLYVCYSQPHKAVARLRITGGTVDDALVAKLVAGHG